MGCGAFGPRPCVVARATAQGSEHSVKRPVGRGARRKQQAQQASTQAGSSSSSGQQAAEAARQASSGSSSGKQAAVLSLLSRSLSLEGTRVLERCTVMLQKAQLAAAAAATAC